VIDPGAPQCVVLRASDADREQTAQVLRQHYELGRLETPEFEARIGRCYAAATVDELRELVADLPRSTAVSPAREPAPRPVRPLALILPVLVAAVALASVTGGHALWLTWPLVFLIIVIVRRRCLGSRLQPAGQQTRVTGQAPRPRRRLRAAADAQGDRLIA